jgi:hypothetical protein
MIGLILLVGSYAVPAIVCGMIGARKGRPVWGAVCGLLGPIGWLFLLLLVREREKGKKCPYCKIQVSGDATACRFCGKAFDARVGLLRSGIISLATMAGAVVAFYTTYLCCKAQGQEALQLGWMFLFLTVPVGAVIGGILARSVMHWACKQEAKHDGA